MAMFDTLRRAQGVVRSLRIYYGDRARAAAMESLYRPFMQPGDLVFDVGAHVGDRVRAFRRLGARVVAVEPQPALVTTLRLLYGRDDKVVIEPLAVGNSETSVALHLNVANPTISTVSNDFVAAAMAAPGWQGQRWTQETRVGMTTLDTLIARHGVPAFIKIDVEGFEAQALAGLSQPVRALSFEFTTIQRDVALDALARCAALGFTRFNAALGESQSFSHPNGVDAQAMAGWLTELPIEANSGDVYAMRA
jgi:FkbM family methyltransferase